MNTCEKYIIKLGGIVDNNWKRGNDGYVLKNRKGKVFIDSSFYEDRKRISKKFRSIIDKIRK